jgi:hypothetical protein
LALLVRLVLLGRRVSRETQAHRALQEFKAYPDHLAQRVTRETLVTQAQKVLKV